MSRPLPWFWIVLAALLLLLPMQVGRFLLDLLGGLTLTLLLLPVLAGGAAWIGWQVLRSRVRTCPACGLPSLAADICPACGASMQGDGSDGVARPAPIAEVDVSRVTINVDAVEVKSSDRSGDPAPPMA